MKRQVRQFRQDASAEDAVIRELLEFDQPVTVDHLLAAGLLRKERGKAAGRLQELAGETDNRETGDAGESLKNSLKEAVENLQENLTDAEAAQTAYGQLEQVYRNILEAAVYGQEPERVDLREISRLYKQISLNAGMAKEENYEVPVEIGGEVTSINLKILHKRGENGRVAAAMETERYGKVAAQFHITVREGTGYRISGYIACEFRQTQQLLEQSGEGLRKMFESADIKVAGLNFIQNSTLDLSAVSQTAGREINTGNTGNLGMEHAQTADAGHGVSTKKLYETAKIFIKYIQER